MTLTHDNIFCDVQNIVHETNDNEATIKQLIEDEAVKTEIFGEDDSMSDDPLQELLLNQDAPSATPNKEGLKTLIEMCEKTARELEEDSPPTKKQCIQEENPMVDEEEKDYFQKNLLNMLLVTTNSPKMSY